MYTSQEGSYLIHACPFASSNEYNCLSDTITGRYQGSLYSQSPWLTLRLMVHSGTLRLCKPFL